MAKTTITSTKDVKVLAVYQHQLKTTTTIKYKDRMLFKLVTEYRNGCEDSTIYMFTNERGWVCLYLHCEIEGVTYVSYVSKFEEQKKEAVQNYWAMVKHLKKIF